MGGGGAVGLAPLDNARSYHGLQLVTKSLVDLQSQRVMKMVVVRVAIL